MCCEICIYHDDCLENDKLKDKCCSQCFNYRNCEDRDNNDSDSDYKNYFKRDKDHDSYD